MKVKLNTGGFLYLEASIQFTVVERSVDKFGSAVSSNGRYKVSTRGYMYSILRADESELIAYHWHPEAKGDVDYPHQHLGTALLCNEGPVSRKNHMRTGRMSFEDVVYNLIELGAVTMHLLHDQILKANRLRFEHWKSWG
ncbi:hypothetical protein ACFV4G_02245 [Kitasatospora sp. NPDC059747]|uniref:hypothetical protein n=1 Tax=Kitasatospora sp. NPDC059747 TaxID=3346930 RepID=UPI0036574EC8